MNAVNDNRSDAMRILGWSLFLVYNPALKQEPSAEDIGQYKIIKSDSLEKVQHLAKSVFNAGGFDGISEHKFSHETFVNMVNATIRELVPSNEKDIEFSFVGAITRSVVDVTKMSIEDIDTKMKRLVDKHYKANN